MNLALCDEIFGIILAHPPSKTTFVERATEKWRKAISQLAGKSASDMARSLL
jgi:hypothetical protein